MIHLAVWITLPDARIVNVGELACTDAEESGRFESEFVYADEWLAHRQRFALDPVSLPLGRGRFRAVKFEPPLAVFEDALPDEWGRRLIIRARRLPRQEQSEPFLLRELAAHGLGMGALSFAPPGTPPPSRLRMADHDLAELFAAAESFDAGGQISSEFLQRLFAAGSSPGGARPKALLTDENGEWIAKFPSPQRDGRFDVVGLEAVGLDLAFAADIAVPDHRLVSLVSTGRRALLVRRFDITPDGGRRHMISLRTLCKERPGAHVQTYTELAEAVRKVSASPQDDVNRLFRQMVYNAAFGNTDDHLKNFWMVHDATGYRLSEAIDLLPDVGERREHCLAFEYGYIAPSRAELLAIAGRWGVMRGENAIEAVLASVATFPAVALTRAVPESDISAIAGDLAQRRMRIQSK